MKSDKLVPGIVLVVIGAAILLANFGYLEFHWDNFERLWPIFIVIVGINLVLSYNKTPWASILRITVVVVGVGLLLFGNFDNDDYYTSNRHGHAINVSKGDNDDFAINGTFNEPYTPAVKVARLNISGGAVGYHLSDTTNQLFSANTSEGAARYDFSSSMDDSVHVMDFDMNKHFRWHFGRSKNRVEFMLNPNPVWEINVNTGASGLDFDLSKFKVRELQIHGGMAGYHVKMGAPEVLTNIEVSTGMSGVDIFIPQNAACSVETDSGLSGNDFDDVPKISDDHYQTAGYDAAKTKFHIHISGGFSGFHVKRY
jgi:hypothetical protein